MANTVKLKRSAVANKTPTTSDLSLGELALNTYDGNLFFKKDVSGTESIVTVATLAGTQTLTNKTLSAPNISGLATFTGEVLLNNAAGSGGSDEGGELHFAIPSANSTLDGPIAIDVYQNKVRIFETTGNNRGVYVDLTTTSNTAGSSLITNDGTQTLTNKTLTQASINQGLKDKDGSRGTSGQLLASTGTGVQWVTRDVSTLDSLTDVTISSAEAGQVLTWTGSAWINADSNATVASAVFATNAQSDLGFVTDLVIGITEDLGFIDDVASLIYDMGQLKLDGIVSLSNIDQSVKADYIGYSIIFGF